MSGKSEIANADVTFCIDKYVLWLQIPMDNGQSVNMRQPLEYLAEYFPAFDVILMNVGANEVSKRL